ncbi:MAG TPA: class I SAM-dependent methyltransferase [Rickettsiales bacterium]|nr:class I SAM-dependent methyltransferase [Rickettsiales bacterium]
MENTKQHITLIKNLLGDKIDSMLDIQCGDGYDIENCKALQDKDFGYIGVDLVDEVIQDNRQYFREEKNKIFMILDASNEPLPKTDLVVCSGMAEYLPIPNIWSLLENIRDSQAKYVAFDYYTAEINGLKINEDIKLENEDDNQKSDDKNAKTNKKEDKQKVENDKPIKRAINLTQAPFYFPEPNCLVPIGDNNHFIALYRISDISFFMDWHNDDVSYLRAKLFNYLESDFNEIKTIFAKYENGEEMFKTAITADAINWDKFYYDEKYKKIIDDNGLFTKYINFLILLYKADTIERLKKDMPERYNELLTEDNYLWASIIAKDFIKWKYNELF